MVIRRAVDLYAVTAAGRFIRMRRYAHLRHRGGRLHAAAGIDPVQRDLHRFVSRELPHLDPARAAGVDGGADRECDLLQRLALRAVRDVARDLRVIQRGVVFQCEVPGKDRLYQRLCGRAGIDRSRKRLTVHDAEGIDTGDIIDADALAGGRFDVKHADQVIRVIRADGLFLLEDIINIIRTVQREVERVDLQIV